MGLMTGLAASLVLVVGGCLFMLAVAVGSLAMSKKRRNAVAPEPVVSPAEVNDEPEVEEHITRRSRPVVVPTFVADAMPEDVTPVVEGDVIEEILAEEFEYAAREDDGFDFGFDSEPIVEAVQPTSDTYETPAYLLPFTLDRDRVGGSTRVTRAVDYRTAAPKPLPMPVAPAGVEPIPELEPTELMVRPPEMAY